MSALSLDRRRGPAVRGLTAIGALIAVAVLGGAAGRIAISHYGKTLIEATVGVVIVCALVAAITRRPRLGVAAIVAALVLFPSYKAPTVQHLTMDPMLPLCLLVAVAAILCTVAAGRWRLSAVDWAVMALAVIMIIDTLVGPRTWKEAASQLWLWLPPYILGRVIVARRPLHRVFAQSMVVGGLVLAPFALAEAAGLGSPFFPSVSAADNPYASPWDQPHLRAGEGFRAQTSFGHPIAYSMFLAVAIVFALVLMGEAADVRRRRQYLFASLVLVGCEVLAVSRTGWVVIAVALILLAAGRTQRAASRLARRWLVAALTVLVAVALFVPSVAAVPLSIVGLQSDTNDPTLQQSASYRGSLYTAAFKGGVASWSGNKVSKLASQVETNNSSIDSEYLVMLDTWGGPATIAFLLVAGAVVLRALGGIAEGGDEWSDTFAACAAALAVGLGSVALITQQEYMVWLFFGLAAVPRQNRPLEGAALPDGRWRFAGRASDLVAAAETNGRLILPALRRYWWILVLCAGIGGFFSYAIPRLKGPKYTATAALLFQTPQFDQILFGHTLDNTRTLPVRQAATNASLVDLPVIAQRTAAAIGPPMTAKRVSSEVVASEVQRSDVYTVVASDPNPVLAARLANTYAQTYLAKARADARQGIYTAIAQIQAKVSALPAAAQHSSAARSLQGQLRNLAFSASLQTGNVESVANAGVPTSAPTVKKKSLIYGAGLGLLAGIVLLLVAARRDRRLTDSAALERTFRAPVLGMIPRLNVGDPLATGVEPAGSDAFGLLRGRLRYLDVDRVVRTVAVTSPAPGEGRSTVALELAVAEAMAGRANVLLLEADLRNPSLRTLPEVNGGPGLSEVLSGIEPLDEALRFVDLSEPDRETSAGTGLWILPAGAVPPNPSELLESHALVALLETLQERFELIIVDTTAPTFVADAFPVLKAVDGVLIVSRLHETKRADAIELRDELENMGATVVGVVANPPVHQRRLGRRRSRARRGRRQLALAR